MAGMNLTVYALDGVVPVVDPTAFVHPTAVLIGDVIVGRGCYIGPAACLRGDFGHIEIRAGANIQDTCVLHGYPGLGTIVGENGHVGHGAVLHGCHVGSGALIGIGAVIMDNVVIGEHALVAAMSFVKEGTQVPPRVLVAGVPARVVRELTETEIAWKSNGTKVYQELAQRSRTEMRECLPLAAVQPDRPVREAGSRPLSETRGDAP